MKYFLIFIETNSIIFLHESNYQIIKWVNTIKQEIMRSLKQFYIFLSLLALTVNPSLIYAISNAPITTAASVSACPGTQVTIPLTVTGFTNITAISLRIEYNPTVMTYNTFANGNVVLAGLGVNNLVVSPTLNAIMVVWSDVNPKTIASGGTLLDLKFDYISGNTILSFDNISNGGSNCEYADFEGNPMNDMPTSTYYINGNITGNSMPAAAGTITGSATVSQGQPGVIYSVPAIANATGYTWSLPSGASIVSGSNTSTITVNFSNSAVSGAISVYGTNSCGSGTISSPFNVTVTPLVTNAPITVAGTVTACPGALATVPVTVTNFTNIGALSLRLEYDPTKMTYSSYTNLNSAIPGTVVTNTAVSPGMHYVLITWTGTGGVNIAAGGKLLDLVFNFTTGSTALAFNNTSNGGADCKYTNGFGLVLTDIPTADFYTNGQVSSSAPSAAGTITGAATVVQGTNNIPYSVTAIANATGYSWTLPTGGTITSGANTNSITVNFSATAVSGNVCVQGTNTCGNGTISCKAVTVNTPQNAPISTAGSLSACAGTPITIPINVNDFLDITAVTLRLDYNPTLMTYVSSANMNSQLNGAIVNNVAVSGTLNKILIVWSDPTPKTIANGQKLVDLNFNFISGSPTLSFNNTASGGSDCEFADANANALNDLPTATYYHDATVTMNPLPSAAGTITGTATVTQGQSGVSYSVPAIANATGYTWTLPTGASVVTGSNTNSIVVDYSASAVSGSITVRGTNSCGNGTVSAAFAVTVNPLPATAPITTAGSPTACPNASVTIPLTTANFNYIASFSLRLEYDPSKMTYSSYSNLNSNLSGASIVNSVVSASVNKIMITWTNATGVSLANGSKIADLNFTYLSGTSALTFNNTSTSGADCQFVNVNSIILTDTPTASYYFDGQVTSSAPATPGTITGLTVVSQGQTGVSYSVPVVANATGYTWTLPPLAVIASGANTSNITVDYAPNSTSGSVTVKGTNSCSDGPTSAPLNVTVNPLQNAPITTITGGSPCNGTQVLIPLTVLNFDQITAVSLRIDYNPAVMTYVSSLNLNPTLTGMIVNNVIIGPTSAKISVVWSDITPKTLAANSKLADFQFNVISGNTTLAFNNTSSGGSECAYGDLNGNPLNDMPTATYYHNGNIAGQELTGAAGVITGLSTVTQGNNGIVYTVPLITNATSYNWTLPAGASIVSGANTNSITVNYSMTAASGNIAVNGSGNCGDGAVSSLYVTVIQLGYTVSGTFTYNNTANTPLDSVWVYLKQNGTTVYTTRTDLTGSYSFFNVFNGTYVTSAVTSKPFNGVNALDATKVSRHVAGLEPLPAGVRQSAADVNLSYTINALDATKIKRRVAGLDNSFARGDWWFEKVETGDTVIVNSANVSCNFYGLCVGDVNGSYNPGTGAKSAAEVNLRYDQTMKQPKNSEFNLPIRIDRGMSLAAITLVLNYPHDLIRIKSASVKQGNLVYNVLPGEVRLVWAEVEPMMLSADESFINLVVQTTDKAEIGDRIQFSLGFETEFGDENANVVSGFDLLMSSVLISNALSVGDLSANNFNLNIFPNPARDFLNVSFELPAEAEVNYEIVSLLGEKIIDQSKGIMSKGKQLIRIDTGPLSNGVYVLNLLVNGKEGSKRDFQKIVITK